MPYGPVRIVRVEVARLLPNGFGTYRRVRRTAVKMVHAAGNVVAGDQMLRRIRFIITMNAFRRRVSEDSRSSAYSDLMDTDQPLRGFVSTL